ncbi:hypothetical protein DFJ67_0011 [Asanoa ferruginea]|uniref:Uncharacterized protein n=2 Tax=Asanoa ferruginea TaxID=53367 RepID=A0A3D9ZCC6_9ACTN|nr:hypothetical protein DFJ67_0011 [Asanoa ferruginea]
MGVVPSGTELSRATTVALLSRLLGDDPDLHALVPSGEYAELSWDGERVGTQWFVYPGRTGVGQLEVSIWDSFPNRPADAYRDEAAPVLEVLRDLANASGGRLIIEEGDVTGAPLDELLDLISVPSVGAPPATRAESDEDYLHRYLAAGDDRLAWLRDHAAAAGTPLRLDFSRESLVPLWQWATGRLEPRAADAPKEKVFLANGSAYQRPTDADLPMWFGRSLFLAPHVWSDESLALIDAISFYALECLRRAVPDLTWRVGHGPDRGYPHEGQPVLAGRGPELEPVTAVIPLAAKVYRVRVPDPTRPAKPPTAEDLRDWFDVALQRAEGA